LLPPPFNVINRIGASLRKLKNNKDGVSDKNDAFDSKWMRWGVPISDQDGHEYKYKDEREGPEKKDVKVEKG
jgi:hypothetical protein